MYRWGKKAISIQIQVIFFIKKVIICHFSLLDIKFKHTRSGPILEEDEVYRQHHTKRIRAKS